MVTFLIVVNKEGNASYCSIAPVTINDVAYDSWYQTYKNRAPG